VIPDHIAYVADRLANRLAEVAGDENAVLDTLRNLGRNTDPDTAAAVCVAALAYTFARCTTVVQRDTPKENN
jgi:hypothetical protein